MQTFANSRNNVFKVFGTTERLPALFCTCAVPSIYYIIGSFWIPHTPFYLLKEGKQNEAEISLEKLREPNKANIFSFSGKSR